MKNRDQVTRGTRPGIWVESNFSIDRDGWFHTPYIPATGLFGNPMLSIHGIEPKSLEDWQSKQSNLGRLLFRREAETVRDWQSFGISYKGI